MTAINNPAHQTQLTAMKHDDPFLPDFIIKTLPGAIGTALYAIWSLGPVAIVTICWVSIQIVFFLVDRYRKERARRIWLKSRDDDDDSPYPGDM